MLRETPIDTAAARRGLLVRAVLAAVTAGGLLAGLPGFVTAPLAAAAALATAERVARHRRRGLLDLALLTVAGPVVVAIPLGFVLNAVPGGLTTGNWAVGTAVVELAALACCLRRPVPPSAWALLRSAGASRPSVLGACCVVAGLLVVTASVVVSAGIAARTEPAPVALWASVDGTLVTVHVEAGAQPGRFEVDLVAGDRRTVAGRVDLLAGGTTSVPVRLTPGLANRVELVTAGRPGALRTLVFNPDDPDVEGQ